MSYKNAQGPKSGKERENHARQFQPPTAEVLRMEVNLHDPRSPMRKTEDETIYDMKLAGHNLRQISAGVNKTEAEVEQSINAMAERSRTRLASELAIATIIEIDRMDTIIQKLWPAVLAGDYGAIDRVNSLSKERRRLLGLDAPEVKASLNVTTDALDLSALSTDQLKQWEAIQQTLKAAKGKTVKAAQSKTAPKGRLAAKDAVIDADFTPVPQPEAGATAARSAPKPSKPQP